MDNKQLAAFMENQVRILEKAFEESDGMMVGADRHEEFKYIGKSIFIGPSTPETHPLEWSEEHGTAIVLDPIKTEIDNMKEIVKTLKGEK